MNPDKGFFVSANNRVIPENSKFDHGAAQISTPRFLRISELIEDKINSN
jgi:acyl-homoserine lactone acylase PvdQ